MLQEEQDKKKLEEQDRKKQRHEQLMHDFNLFLKAQMEKAKLSQIQNKKLHHHQKLATIDKILKKTKTRLKLNPTTKQMKFDNVFKNFQDLDTFVEIKEFLGQINQQNSKEESIKKNSCHYQQSISEDNQKYSILNKAKNRVDFYLTQKFEPLLQEIDGLYKKQLYQSGNELTQETQFMQRMMSQVENQHKNFEIQMEKNKITQSNLKFTRSNPDLLYDYTNQKEFVQDVDNLRSCLKKTTEDAFKRKWGNSLAKKKRQDMLDIKKYQKNQTSIQESLLEKKLSQQSTHYLTYFSDEKSRRKSNISFFPKVQPPNYVSAMKANHQQLMDITEMEFVKFQQEYPGYKFQIKNVNQGLKNDLEQVNSRYEKFQNYN